MELREGYVSKRSFTSTAGAVPMLALANDAGDKVA